MTASSDNATDGPSEAGASLASKVFIVRGDMKLVRHLSFAKAAGQRPNSIRVSVGSKNGTALTLKNASFSRQYQRAIDKIATFYGIPEGDPLRKQMESTAGNFLAYYNLHTEPFKFERQGELKSIGDVAFPNDAEGAEEPPMPSSGPSVRTGPSAMLASGLVRGITYRSPRNGQPALMQVRLWRGKGFNLSLENASFAQQYAKAVDAVANSLGMAANDPTRIHMLEAGQAFLKHYRLVTAAVTIPDVVFSQNPDQQS